MNGRVWAALIVAFGIVKLVTFLFLGKYLFGHLATQQPQGPLTAADDDGPFPSRAIPAVRLRKDASGAPVELGRLELAGGLSPFALGRSFVNTSSGGLKRDFQWQRQSPQLSYAEFNRRLQCPEHEPGLVGPNGVLALARLVPVTRDTLRIMAAYIESEARCTPWAQCRRLADYLEQRFAALNATTPPTTSSSSSSSSSSAPSAASQELFPSVFEKVRRAPVDDRTRLVRVVGGEVVFDWPWGAWRWAGVEPDYFALRLLGAVAEMTALPDVAFFLRNYDYPLLPAFVPVPAMSHAPSAQHSDLPLPWVRAVDEEVNWYADQLLTGAKDVFKPVRFDTASHDPKRRRLAAAASLQPLERLTTSGSGITGTKIEVLSRARAGAPRPQQQQQQQWRQHRYPPPDEALAREEWAQRRSKAAFYGYLWGSSAATARMVALDLARRHPDLLEVQWSAAFDVKAYSPLSDEGAVFDSEALLRLPDPPAAAAPTAGLPAGHLRSYKAQKQRERVPPREYLSATKYLLVLSGNNGADRLGPFLAHSGAVILLQENDALSHFSARLRPWVHYVPVAHTAADVADKVRWLQEHDDEAYQLAKNAHLFARSHLRLEDYYCYTARSVVEMALVEQPDAKRPFSAASVQLAFPPR